MSTAHITIGTSANGKACGAGDYEIGSLATLFATPDSGYSFTQWNDGVTLNPRTVKVTENATYTASFNGSTPASNVIRYNAATAVTGGWVTNNTDTSRNTYDSVTGNGVLYLNAGVTTIGDNEALSDLQGSTDISPFYHKSDAVSVDLSDSGLTSIQWGAFEMEQNPQTYEYITSLVTLLLPDTLTEIWTGMESLAALTAIDIPAGVTYIERYAFAFCPCSTVIFRPTTPPTYRDPVFQYKNTNTVYVPSGSESAYAASNLSNDFTTFLPIT